MQGCACAAALSRVRRRGGVKFCCGLAVMHLYPRAGAPDFGEAGVRVRAGVRVGRRTLANAAAGGVQFCSGLSVMHLHLRAGAPGLSAGGWGRGRAAVGRGGVGAPGLTLQGWARSGCEKHSFIGGFLKDVAKDAVNLPKDVGQTLERRCILWERRWSISQELKILNSL